MSELELGITSALAKPQPAKRKSLPAGSAIQILQLHSGPKTRASRNLKLNNQVLRDLVSKVGDYPIAVIVIAGPGRKGKSFMLTYIVRYLQALERTDDGNAGDWMDNDNPDVVMKGKGFTFRNGMARTTDGIWMWSRPFIIKKSKAESPLAVLVMDTEGCFDPYTNEQEQSSIIGLSLLLSSCFIYNDTGLINENTINTLAQFMQYGQIASQSFEGKTFQRLMFLIRDWNTTNEHGAAGGQGFIRRFLASKHGMSEQAARNRQLIQDNFEDYDAYLMPLPGKKVVSEEFTGSIGEMKPEFRNHVERFAVNLVADVAPKRFGSTLARGSTFFETFEKLTLAFNTDDMPSPSSILEVTIYIALDAKIRNLTQEYEEQFQKKINSKQVPFISTKTLQTYHDKYKKAVENKFKEMGRLGSSNDHQIFSDKLDQSVEHKFLEISKQNTLKQTEFVETVQQTNIQKLQNFVEENILNSSKIWSQPEYEHKIIAVRDNILDEFKNALNGTTESFSQNQVSIFIFKLQETVENCWLRLKEKKMEAEHRATEIIKKYLSDYKMRMDILVPEDVSLNESQLKTLHERHKIRNIQEASNELEKEFGDPDFILVLQNQLEHDIGAIFERIKTNWEAQIKIILDIMNEDLREVVAVFKEEAQEEIQKFPSLENPNLGMIFHQILDAGIQTLDSRNHPDRQIAASYRKQLKLDMDTAQKEIKDLFVQSRNYKSQQCESRLEATTKEFLKAIQDRCPHNDLLTVEEVETIVTQLTQKIRPNYEQTIREISREDFVEFAQRFDKFVAQEKQELNSRNLKKLNELEKAVNVKIIAFTETFDQEMQAQETHWNTLDQVTSSHSSLMLELAQRLRTETPLHIYPRLNQKYQSQLQKEIQKHYEIYTSRFELNVHHRNKITHQMIPEWISNFENELKKYIRSNLFAEKTSLIPEIEGRTDVLEARLSSYASETGLNPVIRHEAITSLREEISKVKVELYKYAADIKKATKENVERIIQSCLQFADNHPIFHDNHLAETAGFEAAQEKLKSDVRGYYDSHWDFPVVSSAQEKEITWSRVHDKLMSKFRILITELLAKSEEKTRSVNQITDSIVANVCPTVQSNLDSDRYFDKVSLRNLFEEAKLAARNDFQRLVSQMKLSILEEMPKFNRRIDEKLDELNRQNTQVMQVAFAEAKIICHELVNKRRDFIKSYGDLKDLQKQAINVMQEYLQSKSGDQLTEKSIIGSEIYSFIEKLHQELLEHLETSVSSEQAIKVTEEAAKIYDTTMRKSLDGKSSVNPENLLEFHDFSVRSAIMRSSKTGFIPESLDLAIRDRLKSSYAIFQEQNYLSHAQGSNLAIGIDLGTTTSCVAVYKNGQVAVIRDGSGSTLTPSYVHFDETGSPIAGNEAKNQAAFFPESTIFDAKRLIGRRFDDPHVQNDMKTWPFNVEPDETGRPLIVVKDKRYTPEEISAEVLGHMRKLAEKHLNASVTKAVITVPANFTDRQRDATRQAALIAGLEVLQMINEPTAAAMAYALNWKIEEKIVLVFDFGGGTFDVTILKTEVGSTNATNSTNSEEVPSSSGMGTDVGEAQSTFKSRGSSLQVLQTGGDTHLGGEDFDGAMVLHCVEQFRIQHGIGLLDTDGSTAGLRSDQQRNRRLRRLRNECEKAKANLTSAHTATIEVDGIHGDLDLKVPITRSQFEKMNEKLFQKAIDIVRKATRDANLQPGDITDVLMVGGSSRIPRVRKLLQDFLKLPILNINQQVDIQEAVAMGAAIQACVLNGGATINNLPLIRDIQPFSLGIRIVTGAMSVIIKQNTRIPCEASKMFVTTTDNQKVILLNIYTGEEALAEDNVFLGSFELKGILPGRAGDRSVNVHMKIDESGILNVTASTPEGIRGNLEIVECRGRYSDEEMAEMRRHSGQ